VAEDIYIQMSNESSSSVHVADSPILPPSSLLLMLYAPLLEHIIGFVLSG
jgi:hypothetical protein